MLKVNLLTTKQFIFSESSFSVLPRVGESAQTDLIQHSCPDGMRNCFQFLQNVIAIAAFGVDYHIPDFGFSLQILCGNVDAFVGENIVDVFQQTGHVFVNMKKTFFVAVGMQ